ncbi:hypothetical protein H920_06204 [Fukomys damarensis]|uniref:Uncharacterized protein n=1 Tax=Fukomys damarensis TaxID=885580 RepID=A0A091EAV0_FUKDA|nr:hypothetical protein H920_06204 [Fukomys damarensis]
MVGGQVVLSWVSVEKSRLHLMHLVGLELAGVKEATATEVSAIELDLGVQQHAVLEMAGLHEGFVAHLALVGPHALVCEQVHLQVAGMLEELAEMRAQVGLDSILAKDVHHQVVLGHVGFLSHTVLPVLPVDHLHQIGVIHLHTEVQLPSWAFLWSFTMEPVASTLDSSCHMKSLLQLH